MSSIQLRKEQRSIDNCRDSLEQSYRDIESINNLDVNLLKFEIRKLINKCVELSYSANEAFKQNQS